MGYLDAVKIGLTDEEYNIFLKAGIISKCVPSQECTWESAGGILKSISNQYDIDEIFKSNILEHKKAKELFLGSLFCYLIEQDTKNKYSVGVPLEDRGIDLFVREINFKKKVVSILGIQMSEFKEKYSSEGLFTFIEEKIKRYGQGIFTNTLLIWLEPVNILKQAEVEECVKMLSGLDIPFRQILIMGKNEDKNLILISEIYSSSTENLWVIKFDYNKLEIIEKGYLTKGY